ncbi:hypothetical protein [Picrophilus oshimae]|uniref:Uncharacterized protein n=1 Tax=Picrophilus torridus (strain ATCC 700027 / DSM 9790 / JCM 10055 / NBRC 100828 / KAW 2/3) TaxID=1122961 RepID=A0A8G2FXV7_PICTO|nr:hypothetical protein [Picrophilus oshimae]SMD31507.1 hypothetical protein SAMN02745355_1453 [Picrophilus oshimae DSM 9789]
MKLNLMRIILSFLLLVTIDAYLYITGLAIPQKFSYDYGLIDIVISSILLAILVYNIIKYVIESGRT